MFVFGDKRQEECSFFKKRTKKLSFIGFRPLNVSRLRERQPTDKSFLVLFFKKGNCLGKAGKRQKAKARMFFFEKKNQKTFVNWLSLSETAGVADANKQKFFGSFFQKRTFLLPLALLTWVVTKKEHSDFLAPA